MMEQFKGKYKNAKVFFRIFPVERNDWTYVKICQDEKTIYCRCLQDFQAGYDCRVPKYWNFETDGVLCNKSQSDIYDNVMNGVIDGVVRGNNAIVVSYGQTGTGKTLTTTGLYNSIQDLGIAPRAVIDLFSKVKEARKQSSKTSIGMSYIETQNAYFVDLLSSEQSTLDHSSLKFITVKKVRNEYEALKLLYKGEGRRELSSNSSYESHNANGLITFHVVTEHTSFTKPVKLVSKLHIVDLAGADTCGSLSCYYKNIPEIATGNLAKSQLEQFLLILCENIPQHIRVKQRINPLIRYVNESLSTNSILRFIGHIRTNKENMTITLSMLRFGQIIKGLPAQKLQVKEAENKEVRAEILEDEIKTIQKQKLLESMLANNDLSTNITQERIKHMKNTAEEYLKNKTNEIVIANVTDINTVLKVFKNLYNDLEAAKTEEQKNIYNQAYADALEKFETLANSSTSFTSLKGSNKGSSKVSRKLSNKNVITRTSKSASKISINPSVDKRSSSSFNQKSSMTKNLEKMGAQSARKYSGSKRKSSASTGIHSLKSSLLSEKKEPDLPEELPSREVAWDIFMNDNGYDYKKLEENVRVSKASCKTANDAYLVQVDDLHYFTDVVERRKEELLQVRMQNLHKRKDPVADDKEPTKKTDMEVLCEENLKEAENKLTEQKEIVLNYQTEFKIALETYHRAKKSLDQEFDQFCSEKFGTLLPDLKNNNLTAEKQATPTPTENIKTFQGKAPDDELLKSDKYNHLMKHEVFKEVMISERKRIERKREESKRWVQR